MTRPHPLRRVARALAFLALLGAASCRSIVTGMVNEDRLNHADLFSPRPEILSAGYGFEGIIGVEGGEAEVRAAGGTWNRVACAGGATPNRRVLTSSVEPNELLTVTRADAMPIVFSWPYLPSTLAATDFSVILNDGSRVTPAFATIQPNYECSR